MSSSAVDLERIIQEIVALPAGERGSWLDSVSQPADLLMSLGDEVERLAVIDAGRATVAGRAVIVVADAVGLAGPRARTRRALAQALAYAGQFEAALDECAAAMEIGSSGGETVEAARAGLASVHALANLGRFDDAIEAASLAHAALLEAGAIELAARADLNLGAVYSMRDDPASALFFLDRARPVFAGSPAILAQLETNRGNALAGLNDFAGAIAAFESAAPAFTSGGQLLAAAITEGNLGSLHARRGMLHEALHHFERARRLLEECDAPSHRARLLAEHAGVTANLGMSVEASDALATLIPELDLFGLKADAAIARVSAGLAAIALGQFESAESLLGAASDALSDAGAGQSTVAQVCRLRAGLALQAEELETAKALAETAAILVADRPADRAINAVVQSRVALAQGDLSAANRFVESGLVDAEALALAPLLADLYTQQGRVRRAQGQPAFTEFERAVDYTERLRGTLQAERFRSAFQADRLAPYEELLREGLENSTTLGIAAAFRAGELLKSRALLDLIGGSFEDRDVAELSGPEIRLAERLETVRSQLNWAYSTIAERGTLQDSREQIRNLEREIDELEGRLAAGRPVSTGAESVAAIDDVRNALESDETLVSYCTVEGELAAFVISRDGVSVVRGLATMADLSDALRRFRLQIARAQAHGNAGELDRLTSAVQRELRVLHGLVLQPLEAHLGRTNQLIVAPAGLLHTLPFAALWDGDHYLIERFQMATVPSASLFVKLRSDRTGRSQGSMVVAGIPDALTPNIPNEIAHVAAQLPGCSVLLGEDATAAATQTALQGSALAHIACHGRYARQHPKASGLKLADRWLTLAEISRLRLANAHVTLSACDTGRVSIHAGDELVGLTRGFYAAGARSLIVSLWPVNDSSTTDLMTRVYAGHAGGASFGAALRQAQMHAIAGMRHPAHWAPFVFGGAK